MHCVDTTAQRCQGTARSAHAYSRARARVRSAAACWAGEATSFKRACLPVIVLLVGAALLQGRTLAQIRTAVPIPPGLLASCKQRPSTYLLRRPHLFSQVRSGLVWQGALFREGKGGGLHMTAASNVSCSCLHEHNGGATLLCTFSGRSDIEHGPERLVPACMPAGLCHAQQV